MLTAKYFLHTLMVTMILLTGCKSSESDAEGQQGSDSSPPPQESGGSEGSDAPPSSASPAENITVLAATEWPSLIDESPLRETKAPGLPDGYVFSGLGVPSIGDSGHVVFLAQVQRGNESLSGIWGGMPDSLELLVKEGDPVQAPGAELELASSFSASILRPTVTNSGDFLFQGFVRDTESDEKMFALVVSIDGQMQLVAMRGDQAEGFPVGTEVLTIYKQPLVVDESVVYSALVGFDGEDPVAEAIWRWSPDGTELLAVSEFPDSSVPGAGELYDLPQERVLLEGAECRLLGPLSFYFQMTETGSAVFWASLANMEDRDSCGGSDVAIVEASTNERLALVHERTVMPGFGQSELFFLPSQFVIADNGLLVFGGTGIFSNLETYSGLWMLSSDRSDIKQVAISGELLPDDYDRRIDKLSPVAPDQSDMTQVTSTGQVAIHASAEAVGYLLRGLPRHSSYNSAEEVGVSLMDLIVKGGGSVPVYAGSGVVAGPTLRRSATLAPGFSMNSHGEIAFKVRLSETDDPSVGDSTEGVWFQGEGNEVELLILNQQEFRYSDRLLKHAHNHYVGGVTSGGMPSQFSDTGALATVGVLRTVPDRGVRINAIILVERPTE